MYRAHVPWLAVAISCVIPSTTKAQVPTELREAMRAWDQASVSTDVATWGRLTADNFTAVLADGTVLTKAQALARFTQRGKTPPQPLLVVDGRVLENAAVFAPTTDRIDLRQQEATTPQQPLLVVDGRVFSAGIAEPTGRRVGLLQQEEISQYDHVFVRRGLRAVSGGDARALEIWAKSAGGWRVVVVQYTSVIR